MWICALRLYEPFKVNGLLLSLRRRERPKNLVLHIMLVYLWLTIGQWKNYIGLAAGPEGCRYSFKTQASQYTISYLLRLSRATRSFSRGGPRRSVVASRSDTG
jgi:hypothetical protein